MSCQRFCRFYPHAPSGARPEIARLIARVDVFLSARPERGATAHIGRHWCAGIVSIRTPRAGRDVIAGCTTVRTITVSIRTPRAGRDLTAKPITTCWMSFYPHAPSGARPEGAGEQLGQREVSIRTPRAGRDEL